MYHLQPATLEKVDKTPSSNPMRQLRHVYSYLYCWLYPSSQRKSDLSENGIAIQYYTLIPQIHCIFQRNGNFLGISNFLKTVKSYPARWPLSFFTKPLIIDSNSSLKGRAFSTPVCAARTWTSRHPVRGEVGYGCLEAIAIHLAIYTYTHIYSIYI